MDGTLDRRNSSLKDWGERDAGVQQNIKCATAGRGACGCVDYSISEASSDIYDHLRAGKAWKAPRTEETAETNSSNLVPMDVDAVGQATTL